MARSLGQRGLQAFRSTMLTGSVSAAAGSMNLSQPAVSRLLKDLEQTVGFRLFDRIQGRLRPTPEALLLFEEVQRSFIGLDRIASIGPTSGSCLHARLLANQRGALPHAGRPSIR